LVSVSIDEASGSVTSGVPDIQVGDVLHLHERVTRFSAKNVLRWTVVVTVGSSRVRVVGRTASGSRGVFTPAGLLQEFDLDGYFWPASAVISRDEAERAGRIGTLPEPYRTQVLAQYRRRRR
jgi:hypothetical protein